MVTDCPSFGRASIRTTRESGPASVTTASGRDQAWRETESAGREFFHWDRLKRLVKRGDIEREPASPRRAVGARGAVDVSRQGRGEAGGRPFVERGGVSGVAAVKGAAHRLEPLRHGDIRVPH